MGIPTADNIVAIPKMAAPSYVAEMRKIAELQLSLLQPWIKLSKLQPGMMMLWIILHLSLNIFHCSFMI